MNDYIFLPQDASAHGSVDADQCLSTSPPLLLLKYWNKKVATISVIARPMKSDDIKVNGFVPSVNTDVNCKIGI